MDSIGVRELRQNASKYLRRAAEGEAFEITDRGKPVAVLLGNGQALAQVAGELIEQLVAEGAFDSPEEALEQGVGAVAGAIHRREVDRQIVEGYTRIPPEPDPALDALQDAALGDLPPW